MDDRPQTPPHQPNAGVHLSPAELQAITELAFPGSTLAHTTFIPTTKSFNNRIYMLTVAHANGTQELVLKANGRYFGANKVQNEIACLQLLEKQCPSLPVPRAVAWSETGKLGTFPSGEQALEPTSTHGGWILITKVPGEPVATDTLSEADARVLGRQIAEMVATWRKATPQKECGNLTLADGGHTIQGLMVHDLEPTEPVTSVQEYYRLRLEKNLHDLTTSNTYEKNRSLIPLLQKFIADIPSLQLPPTDTFVFTHYDLSPRNVLTSGCPPTVTGLVDFEFAGFFQPVEEFLNDYVGNRGDWPAVYYKAYLERLEELGVATPIKSLDKEAWNRIYWLESMLENIAPWWLPGKYEGAALDRELSKAEGLVRETLRKVSLQGSAQVAAPAYDE